MSTIAAKTAIAKKPSTSTVKKVVAKTPDAPISKKAKVIAKKVIDKASGAVAKKAPSTRPAPVVFKAPADFKPAFFEVEFATMRDGLVNGASVKINRVKGNWTNAEAKRYDLSTYDQATLNGVVARLGAIYAPNILKRLPLKTKFGLVLRVNKRAADGNLSVLFKGIKQSIESKKTPGKFVWKWFEDKSDVTYRKIRKISRILPSAFVNVQLPPSGRQPKKTDEE